MGTKRIAIMTGGGDAPGLNGIIESTVRALKSLNFAVVGIRDGFEGIFGKQFVELQHCDLTGLHAKAGTLLGTSNRTAVQGRESVFLDHLSQLNVEGLVVAGGDGTFSALRRLSDQLKIIGVPKTIDNDLAGTEITFGFDTACEVVSDSVDALRATAEAHRRAIVVETMGRTAGWIALGGGLASYADAILIPERPFQRSAFLNFVLEKQRQGQRGLLIVAAEGARAEGEDVSVAFEVADSPQKERFGGFAEKLSRWIEAQTSWESRHVVLGHLQRSNPPTTTDRFLTLTMGVEVANMVSEGAWGQAVVYRQGRVQRAPLSDLMAPARLVSPDHRWVQMAARLGIFI
ncbi:MAG: 6-phosphofructokinase [Bdellovibrio sp.]|nr:MAG: 6-phosphofructokinase [Bdellovibrio sp.]